MLRLYGVKDRGRFSNGEEEKKKVFKGMEVMSHVCYIVIRVEGNGGEMTPTQRFETTFLKLL